MVVVSYIAVVAASIAVVYVISRVKPLCYVLTGQVYRPWFKRAATPVAPATQEPAAASAATPAAEPDVTGAATAATQPPAGPPTSPRRRCERTAAGASPRAAQPRSNRPPGRPAGAPAGSGNEEVPTAEIVLPKVWRPEPAKVRPPVAPGDTAERPGRGRHDAQQPPSE